MGSSNSKIPTFVINLKHRKDRLQHILNEFEGRDEFNVTIVKGIPHTIGAIGLWQTMRAVVLRAKDSDIDYVLLCEDDHMFTSAYHVEILRNCIAVAKQQHFDLLLGGVSASTNPMPFTPNLFWLEKFTGLQFTLLFKSFYDRFLKIELQDYQNIDMEMHNYTDNIFVMYPQISHQRNFNYSDITSKNADIDVTRYFEKTERKLATMLSIISHYERMNRNLI